MARLESISVGGYYPTPPTTIPLIASLFHVEDATQKDISYVYLDPCAGDGAAILQLLRALHGERLREIHLELNTIEMELTRFSSLKTAANDAVSWAAGSTKHCLHGDAFCVDFETKNGCSLLYLNPPYDTDPRHGRLEEKFLERFASTLATGGVLAFVVPFYALAASAKTLALMFHNVQCFRFPEPEFSGYKQVVLLATKRKAPLLEPDTKIFERVVGWAKDAASIKPLKMGAASYTLPVAPKYGETFSRWVMKQTDFTSLLQLTAPWSMTDRTGKLQPIPGILPEGALEDLLVRHYPVAMPPRSAHIAAGIAAGIFNGARIVPDKPESSLPPILVKGVFDKEFRTVEEKTDKDGNVRGVVQVQQPKLVTTVLDLRESLYVTIKPSADVTGTQELSGMTMADLLAEYGRGLMQVMLKQCPVLHDPARVEDHFPLPKLARNLFTAQAHATQATIKLLGGPHASKKARRFKSAFVLGEIGSGKTSVALATAEAIKAKRTLVLCPPHLLQSWCDQNEAVTPWVKTVVLSDIEDMQALSKETGPVIAVLSRESAKLGHAYTSVSGLCPKCGTPLEDTDFAKKREVCGAQKLLPRGDLGKIAVRLALAMYKTFPSASRVRQLLRTRPLRALLARLSSDEDADHKATWPETSDKLDALIDALLPHEEAWDAVMALLVADPRPARLFRVARAVRSDAKKVKLALFLAPDGPELEAFIAEFEAADAETEKTSKHSYYKTTNWESWRRKRKTYATGVRDSSNLYDWETSDFGVTYDTQKLKWKDHLVGIPATALEALSFLGTETFFKWSKPCGEPLFQAVPEPRRYPLATFIARRYPNFFDLLILDECHEYATDGAAQERSAHRLTGLGLPTLALTGTIMNGYAESMFTNMWALSDDFRQEFARDERARFVDRFGYRKRLVEDREKDSGDIVAYGSMSDRVERCERTVGHAPGVLPLFLLRYLLPIAVTLHKTDLAMDIPSCSEHVETVAPDEELLARYRQLESALVRQIKKDRFEPMLAGKLWGAMANLPSYLDLATEDTGNEDGRYIIRYPESVGGCLVATVDPFPLTTILPKEAWMLDRVQTALDNGRNVMVFGWHTSLLPRLSRLLEKRLGTKCPILEPSKVPTKKRQKWIDEQIVAKKRRVLVVNPVTIQTGLNNLVYFSDEIWMENPHCDPTIYRQTKGRVDRIGQDALTEIYFPLYAGTSQQALHSLLMHKVAVSMSTDGLDAESALRAAGVGEDSGFSSFAVGRQLYEMLSNNRPMVERPVIKRATALPPKTRTFSEAEAFEYAMSLE